MDNTDKNRVISENPGAPTEVFQTFLKLGLTSFGGPVAHLGYFRKELVEKRKWLSDDQFAQLLAICQFLPGPASSQLGFSLGLLRGGWLGALAAFIGFTLPSALLLIAFATLLPLLSHPVGQAAIHGLKLVACAVVADAILGMSRTLCPDAPRKVIGILAASMLLIVSSPWMQLAVVATAALCGSIFLRLDHVGTHSDPLPLSFTPRAGALFLFFFTGLLLGLPALAAVTGGLPAIADAFYRAGALVFGGGHVVLPLLQDLVVVPGWITADQFLAGYGASQAIPGPMFAFSAYLGTFMAPGVQSLLTATTALLFIFLPGFLLVAGVLPFWHALSHAPMAQRAIAGVNAAVVGLLGAALYNPIFISGITGSRDLAIALIGFGMLVIWRISPLFVVLWCVCVSVVSAAI